VPLYNEAESLPKLYEWIARVMKEKKFSYEIIFVNDGSIDNSWEIINQLKVLCPRARSEGMESLKLKEVESGELEVPTNAKKDLARLFQALRIEVNDEMGALREMLVAARDLLKPGGRIAVLTYHSLEDRLVKNFLRSGNLEGTIEKDFYGNNLSPFELIEKGREASAEEVARNPRARSAKLRVAEKK